ncbi:hypothetical protein CAL7716_023940 [Calothrix sp. PCC 7716]|nr:hypothetical protein CAL7716_023940 [Calothrix sp. PCC 7716]
MKYTGVSYKRVKNLGNYESEHLELFADIDSDENVDDAVDALKKKVKALLGVDEVVKPSTLPPPPKQMPVKPAIKEEGEIDF